MAEDSVQDACVVAVRQWTAGHVPRDPQAWLAGVARHKALDRLRREARRPAKEAATAALAPGPAAGAPGATRSADEDLWLIYLCCHPALSAEARISLTLRAVGGLTTAEIAATDWRQISVLYGELLKYDPSLVTEANRAIAVAMAEGPAAGLTILDVVLGHPQLATWPRIHVARADLLGRMGRDDEAARAYRTALELEPPAAERRYIQRRLARD